MNDTFIADVKAGNTNKVPIFTISAFRTALKVITDIKKYWLLAMIIVIFLTVLKMIPVCINKEYTELPPNYTVRIVFAILYVLSLPLFVVPWIKKIVDPEKYSRIRFKYDRDEWQYLVKLLLFVAIVTPLAVPIALVVDVIGEGSDVAAWGWLISTILYMVFVLSLVLRLALIIPAAALGHNLSLKQALTLSQNNTWKILQTYLFTETVCVLIASVFVGFALLFKYFYHEYDMINLVYGFLDSLPDYIRYRLPVPELILFFFPKFVMIFASFTALSISTLITAGTYADIYRQLVNNKQCSLMTANRKRFT